MNFPQLSNVNNTVYKTINDRIGNNVKMSSLKPWIQLTSALDGGLIVQSLPTGDGFGARYGTSETPNGRIGVDWSGKSIYADAGSRKLRPSPTVEGIAVANGTEGLSRKITFTVKCFTLPQTELIMKYFQEPGFTVLVEYGWNTKEAIHEKSKCKTACDMVAHNNLGFLQGKRKRSLGCYDAFLGYITGGGMKYGDGETFDVSVELTTLGEIPTYLQPHKGIASVKKDGKGGNESSKVYNAAKIKKAIADKEIGKALFMQMFNELPGAKQGEEVQAIMDETEYRQCGTQKIALGPFASTGNFINMDQGIREGLSEDLVDTNVRIEQTEENKGKTAKIPEGSPLISNQRYIRLGLAFKILNTTKYKFEPIPSICGKASPTLDFRINPDYAVCRAHKHMFSADASKLFIPNKNMPEFGLLDALTATEALNGFIDLSNLGKEDAIVDVHPEVEDSDKRYFPNDVALSETDLPSTESYTWDSDYIPYVCEPFQYGLLTDLFINFDFFLECLNKNGLIVKDVVLDMLNGISSAVNFYWDFQVGEKTDKKGDITPIAIYDASFCGKKASTDTIKKFQSRGLDSPFIDCGLDFDIPGAMKNQIVSKRLSPKKTDGDGEEAFVSDGRQIRVDGLFSTAQDPVLTVLNGLKEAGAVEDDSETEAPTDEEEETEARKLNYELFMGKAGVFPKIQDRNGNTDAEKNWYDFLGDSNANTLQGLLVVGTWNDSGLLKTIQLKDEGKDIPIPAKGQSQNSVLLPIKFNFTIPGISGILIGNIFKIIDLPQKYADRVFQVTKVEHSIQDAGWTTTVESQIRNQT